MPDPNTKLTMRLSPVTSNKAPYRYLALTIEDVASGTRFVQMNLEPEHVMQMISNQQVGEVQGMDAWLLPAEHRHQLGKLSRNVSVDVERWGRERADINQWAEHARVAIRADSVSARAQNTGNWHIVFTFYLDPAREDLSAYMADRQTLLDELPRPKADQ